MWVPYVTGTPKMSQIGSLIYGISLILKQFFSLGNLFLPLKCFFVNVSGLYRHFLYVWGEYPVPLHVN